jgi:hypothetical protein
MATATNKARVGVGANRGGFESEISPAPGIVAEPSLVHDEPAASTHRGSRAAGTTTWLAARRTPLARLLAVLRGDEYMVGAFPPVVGPTKEG